MLMARDEAALLVVDLQARLVPAVEDGDAILQRAGILLAAASRLDVPVVVSEQYPQGLGHTDSRLRLPGEAAVLAKTTFSCLREPALASHLEGLRRRQIVVCGMETHVCVLQTALDLHRSGYRVFVAADAVGSRAAARRQLGLDRMRAAGITIVDSEMVVFEWLERAATETFRELVKSLK